MFSLTLTGADQWTDTEALAGQRGVEFGLLYSRSNTANRYPDYGTLVRLLKQLPNPALHVCGSQARDALFQPNFWELAGRVNRIQVNGRVTVTELNRLLSLYPAHVIITQHRPGNEPLAASWHQRHCILVDGSGGQGILPDKWEQPDTQRPVGFAGGLTPDNLKEQLSKILAVRKHSWWVDMESGLRTDDRFDVDKALTAAERFRWWCSSTKVGRCGQCGSTSAEGFCSECLDERTGIRK